MKNNRDIKKKPSFKSRFIAFVFTVLFMAIAIIGFWILFIFLQMPSLDSMLNETRAPVITFVDRNGGVIRYDNRIMGAPVSVSELPPHVWQSVIAIEDKRFFNHGAMDYRGTLRALFSNIFRGGVAQGGSSITQQTAKNIFLSSGKTLKRKVQELIIAHWLEKRFSKEQILDLYLNRVSLVGNLRGIDAAAQNLFGINATELSISQSTQLAAMLKAPTAYNPIRNPEKNHHRARIVLVEMVKQKFISLDEARTAATELPTNIKQKNIDTNITRYWTDFVLDAAKSQIGDINSDVKIYTTLDMNLQEKIANIIKDITPQGAVVAIENDGAIRAMIGGKDYVGSQFNRVLAHRQPGSTFKPIVYLVALENGMTPDDIVNDSPFTIGDYNPKNYNEKYYGDLTLADAFARSVNSVPLKLTSEYGIDSVMKMAGRLGIGANLRREYSTVLGASEMSLMDLTTMFSVIFNDGYSVRPYAISKIISTNDNEVLYERNPSEPLKIISDMSVDYMMQMLADVVATGGTGARANTLGVIGGKTGTSNDYRDAWFIGNANNLTIGVWVGNDDNTPMKNITGGTIPAEIFRGIVMK